MLGVSLRLKKREKKRELSKPTSVCRCIAAANLNHASKKKICCSCVNKKNYHDISHRGDNLGKKNIHLSFEIYHL